MKKTKLTRSLLAAVSVVALSAVVYGCSSGVSDADHQAAIEAERKAAAEAAAAAEAEKQAAIEAEKKAAEEAAAAAAEKAKMEAEEAARQAEMERLARIEAARQAIAAATTAAEAQAAKDAVNDDATATEAVGLQAAVDARIAALMTMGRAEDQKMALMEAADAIDTSDLMTQADIDAAEAAIGRLQAALRGADDVSDADKAMYEGQVTAAEMAVASAQSALDHAAQTMALSEAVTALQAIDLSDLSTQDAIDAAEMAIGALRTALDNATELSDAEKTAAMTLVATAQRTVMTAQGRYDTASQMMMLAIAVEALEMIDLDALMTQGDIDDAEAAIIALDLALAAATNLTDAEKLDATVDVTLAKRKLTDAKETLAENVGDQRMALTEAGTALGEIDLDDLDTAEKITAANNAVMALKAALDGATHLSDAAKAMYQSQYDTAMETVRTAQTGMDRDGRMTAQRTAIMNAVTMARTAVAGVSDTSTDSEVASADAAVKAVKDAIAAAEDLSENDAEIISAKAVLSVIEPQLANAKSSRDTAMAKAEEERGKANAATGEAMYAALAGPSATTNALGNLDATALPSLGATGLTVTSVDDAGSLTGGGNNPANGLILEADGSAGALGSWNGMDYADSTGTGDDMVTNEARVYTNKGPGNRVAFTATSSSLTATAGGTGTFDVPSANAANVMGTAFTHQGTRTHPLNAPGEAAFVTRGTYLGAPGEYRCTGACTSANDGSGAPSALGGVWTFKPDAGAMVLEPDDEYLFYGWWVSKDSKGMPTAASAFAGVVEANANDLDRAWDGAWTPATPQITGSATYAGNAVGKFAMNNPLDSTGNGGHFTADAELNAKFSGANPGVTGTIDNFRLNDGTEDPGWSVSLNDGAFGEAGAFAPVDDTATTNIDESMGTVWSINGNSAPRSGTWSGTMYDEMPGNTDDTPAGDGSNIPTTVTGTFYSEFSTIGRMVGAFGADKQ